MKRSILLTLVAMLALTIGLNGSASAGGSADAQAAAKKGKSKGCKRKGKGKGKAYAGSSAKKKAKGKGCKKGKAKPKGTPTPAGGDDTVTPPGASWPPADGTYSDLANGVTLVLTNGGTSATQTFSGQGTCIPALISTIPAPTSVAASSLTTTGEVSSSGAFNIFLKSKMVVTPGLGYEATVDSKVSGGIVTPCDKPGVVFKGTLAKIGF